MFLILGLTAVVLKRKREKEKKDKNSPSHTIKIDVIKMSTFKTGEKIINHTIFK